MVGIQNGIDCGSKMSAVRPEANELLKPPKMSNQPVPPKKPAITGKGKKRTRLPSLNTPRKYIKTPVAIDAMATVATMVANITSRDCPVVAVPIIRLVTTTKIAVGTS